MDSCVKCGRYVYYMYLHLLTILKSATLVLRANLGFIYSAEFFKHRYVPRGVKRLHCLADTAVLAKLLVWIQLCWQKRHLLV